LFSGGAVYNARPMRKSFSKALFAMLFAIATNHFAFAQVPVVTTTNTTIRVMVSNLSSGNNQRYETAGLNILKGLKPDVVAMQEFNVSNSFGINTTAAIRSMIDSTFGTNFVYFREISGGPVTIPNGIISRFPILTNGIWDDPQLADRNFAWAKLDLPGTNDLYVISVHLHSSGGSSSRAIEATTLTNMIRSSFPANAFVILAGDFNTDTRSEAALSTFKTILSDDPIPTDQNGDPDTNSSRGKPYDYVLPSFSLRSNLVATVIGSHSFSNGLVFDSRVYTPLSEVSPVTSGDSGVFNMQHMGVVKDFKITYAVTNFVTVPAPILTSRSANVFSWQGVSNLTYSIQASTNLPSFQTVGSATSTGTNFSFTNTAPGDKRFFRVVYP
jgi:endonuclease/exonuclease/phosphatase family metal-dependent hydrolase